MTQGSRLYFAVTVLMCAFVSINGVGLNDLLERASQLSDKLHSLSTSLTNDLEDELLSLARSLLLAWSDPLALLSSEASSLAHPERNTIDSKTKELQDNINSLGAGLEHVFQKMGSSSDNLSSLPFYTSSLGQDKTSRLVNFHFLLSCFRRDSHKIDSFLKVLRCRAAKKRPEMC
ncbi:hypothetical protein cypCar_00017365 [Cyprinus carpio]|nr:hypothetical protein cypCar_00017365 [Cyprinus carpio]